MRKNSFILFLGILLLTNYAMSQDLSVCGRSVVLNANVENYSSFSWFCDDVSGTFSNAHSLNTTFTLANDVNLQSFLDIKFYYNVNVNGEIASDTIDVRFYKQPSARISMSEGDTVACGLTCGFLSAEYHGTSGFWYENNSSTMFNPVSNTITSATVTSYGSHTFYWVECNGSDDNPQFCKDTAGPWSINFIRNPSAQIRDSVITFCSNYGQLYVDFNGIGEGRWTTSAPSNIISIDNPNSNNTMIYSTMLNTQFTFYWTVWNTYYCADRDSVKVLFASVPSDSIKVIPPKCFGEPAILTAYEDSLANYDWQFGNGIVDSTMTNSAGGEFRVFVHWNDNQDNHSIGMTATNSWGCQSNIGRSIINEPRYPEYHYNIISDTCALGKGGIEFIDDNGQFSFFWIDTTVGPEITNPAMGYAITNFHIYNLPAGTYTNSVRSDYQTYNREYILSYQQYFNNDIYCHDYPTIEIGTIGLIEADFAVSADVIGTLEAPANAIFVNYTNYDNIGNCTCEWHFGDGAIVNNCNELVGHIYTEPNCYEPYLIVMNRDLSECRDTAFLDDCLLVRSDVADFYYSNISISPNPATDILNITSSETISEIEIVNVMGQVVKRIDVNSDNAVCDVEGLKSGVYVVKVSTLSLSKGANVSQRKFIKE